jgi:UDP-glucuronate decarboxylase
LSRTRYRTAGVLEASDRDIMNANRKVLVAGGAGFLGSHLCDRLLADGCDVICVDNFVTGSQRNIRHLLGNPHFILRHQDIAIPLELDVSHIFNMACPASPVHYQLDPIKTTTTILRGAINLLSLARRVGATILQASTSEVYGDPEVHPQKETYQGRVNPIGVRACYDEGKRCAETLFFDYHRQHQVHIKVVRIFNTYGPRMDPQDGRVVSNFIVQALRHEPLTLFGDGRQTRSFCFVDDLIDGLILMMNSSSDVTGPVNLGNPDECTIRDLAERIAVLSESTSPIRFGPRTPDDPRRRCPDIALARSQLRWEPSTAMEPGLLRTISYFRKRLSETSASSGMNENIASAEKMTTRRSPRA